MDWMHRGKRVVVPDAGGGRDLSPRTRWIMIRDMARDALLVCPRGARRMESTLQDVYKYAHASIEEREEAPCIPGLT